MSFSRRDFLKLSGTLGAGFLLGACSGAAATPSLRPARA